MSLLCACRTQAIDEGPLDPSGGTGVGGGAGGIGAGGCRAVGGDIAGGDGVGGATVGGSGAGGDPNLGSQGPSSAQVLATTNAPWGLAVDATTVYVAGQGVTGLRPLVSVPIAGGSPSPLTATSCFTVAIDETRVYWSDGTSILSCAKRNCADSTTTLGRTSVGETHGIAVDATSVYWATTSGGKIMKVGKNGGTAFTLASGSYPYQVAVDETAVYWTDQEPGTIMKVPTSGGVPVQIATGQGPMGIAVDGQNVYFTTGDGKMVQVPKDGGTARTLSDALGNEPWGITTDGANVYGASMGNGTIVKVPVGGGALTVLAAGQRAPAGIAVDATYVYWTDVDAGTVMRAAK